MWFTSRKTRRDTKVNAPRPRRRPRLETLEDRCVPTAGWLADLPIAYSATLPESVFLRDFAPDADGNTYATGDFIGTMTAGTTTLTSNGAKQDLFVVKVGPVGNVLWAHNFGSAETEFGSGIDVGEDGSVYVSGYFSGTLTLPTAAGPATLTSAGGKDLLVMKLDALGTVAWARRGGSTADDVASRVAVASDGSGSVYVHGGFEGAADFGSLTATPINGIGDAFLAKLDPSGDFLWVRQLDYAGDQFDIMTETGGDVFMVGSAVARYEPDGDLLWNQERERNVGALYQDPMTGKDYLYINEFYNDQDESSPQHGVLRKLDGDTGVEIWSKPAVSGQGTTWAVATDAGGNVYVASDYNAPGDFDPGAGVFSLTSPSGYVSSFLLKLDAEGDFVSARRIGGFIAFDVEVDAADDVFIGGVWGYTSDFELGDGTVTRTSSSSSNGFLLKMPQGLGSISGRVFADADNNGTPGTDEPPMAGATVYLDQNGNNSLDAGEATATTDVYGVYNLPYLPAGTYTVRQVLPAGWSSSAPALGAHVVTLAVDQFVGGRDFGAYRAPTTTTYTNSKSLKITDMRTVTSTIVVSGGTSFIYDVDVKLNISHPNDADLGAFLIAPDGTGVQLMNRNGGTGDNYTNTIFDDEAAVSITEGAAPFSGSYRPFYWSPNSFDGLKGFDGKNANGTWTLSITDNARKNTGTLLGWSLTIKGASGGSALLAAGAPVAGNVAATLTADQLQPLVAEAVARWGAAGADTWNLANVTVHIADLGGNYLGLADGNTIWIDDDAAGWGWFVDPTPGDDSEFTTAGNQGEQGRMDLLTALMHEMGHLLGLDHQDEGVMHETLAAGTREGLAEQPAAVIDELFSRPAGAGTFAPFWGDVVSLLAKKKG